MQSGTGTGTKSDTMMTFRKEDAQFWLG